MDVDGNIVEACDLVVVPKSSNLTQHIVLGFTKRGILLSCIDGKYGIIHSNDLKRHDRSHYVYKHTDMLILKKNVEIPEKLIKFVRKF